jgi:Tfp pilus assembly protein PilO
MTVELKKLDRLCMAIGLAVVIAFAVVLFTKGMETHRGIQRDLRAQDKILKELGSAEAELKALRRTLAERKAESAALKGRITETNEIGTFLKDLDVTIKKRKILLNMMQPQPLVREKTYVRRPIHLAVSGPFPDIQEMLRDLDSMERLIETEKISITKAGTDKVCQAEMVISIFQHL